MLKAEIDLKAREKNVVARGTLADITKEIAVLINEVSNVIDEDEVKFMYYENFFRFALKRMEELQDK